MKGKEFTRGVTKVMKAQTIKNRQFLTERDIEGLGLRSAKALRNDRWAGRGIPFYRVGRSVRYALKDVRRFLEQHRVEPDKGEV